MTPIVLSDQVKPDWAALRSARLLSSQDGALLLEVIIHNFENSDLPLQEISIGLSHPRSAKIACIREDPRQSVTLEWERIQATEGADGAWTTLGNTKIKVGVAYRNTGECSDYTFAASVPVQQIVPQGGSARISLILRGVGSVSAGANSLEPESLFLGRRKSIPPLQSWLTWRVGASADASIWPKTLLVSRQ